jgi:DNA replication licensing factor MCM5
MIFLVRDKKDVGRDKLIAHHVVDVHMRSSDDTPQTHSEGDQLLDPTWLKRYIAFARSRYTHAHAHMHAACVQ